VEQGGSLSSTAFNWTIDALIAIATESDLLLKTNGIENILVYVDDLKVANEREDKMKKLILLIEKFCRLEGLMKLNEPMYRTDTIINSESAYLRFFTP